MCCCHCSRVRSVVVIVDVWLWLVVGVCVVRICSFMCGVYVFVVVDVCCLVLLVVIVVGVDVGSRCVWFLVVHRRCGTLFVGWCWLFACVVLVVVVGVRRCWVFCSLWFGGVVDCCCSYF